MWLFAEMSTPDFFAGIAAVAVAIGGPMGILIAAVWKWRESEIANLKAAGMFAYAALESAFKDLKEGLDEMKKEYQEKCVECQRLELAYQKQTLELEAVKEENARLKKGHGENHGF